MTETVNSSNHDNNAKEKARLKTILSRLSTLSHAVTARTDSAEVVENYMEEDRKLHLLIARAGHNSVLFTVFSGVNLMMKETHWKTLKSRGISKKGNISKYHRNHTVIVNAICTGDPNVARKEMRKHIADLKIDLFGS